MPLFLIINSCLNCLFQMSIYIYLEPFYAYAQNFKFCFIAAEKQLIVSSKQPIVSFLTALWKNWINASILSVYCRSQLWKDPESIKLSWKPDCVMEEVTTCHKGFHILKIQKPLWLVKDHMWWPCGFLLFCDVFCAGLGPVFSCWRLKPTNTIWSLYDSVML